MDYDYRLYSLYLLSDLSLTVDYIPQEHPALVGRLHLHNVDVDVSWLGTRSTGLVRETPHRKW